MGGNFERLVEQELDKYGSLTQLIPRATLQELLLSQKPRLPELFPSFGTAGA